MVASAEIATELAREPQTLVDLLPGTPAVVASVDAQRVGSSVARRLAEIGFLPGEIIRVLARVPGGGPIAVRIGSSTFALRRHEAAGVRLKDHG